MLRFCYGILRDCYGFKPEVIADCISISKESLRMRKKRLKEKLSSFWAEQLFPETDTVTKTVTNKCYDNGTQHISGADEANLLLRQNQLNAKDMETKNLVFDAGNRRTQQIRTRS